MRLLLKFLVAVLLSVSAAVAQQSNDNVFIVAEVPVEAEAGSATEARRIAIDQGRRQAMDILLRRVTAESDWGYLPQLAIGRQAAVGQPAQPDMGARYESGFYDYTAKSAVYLESSQLPALEEGFAVQDEKSSSRSYSARITYRFKADEIRSLLKRARIPYSESQTRRALVLPVLQTENDAYLWESNNPWARAWLSRSLANELTPILLPRGDAADINIISADQALAMRQGPLQQLAQKYGVTQVIVAQGYLMETDGQYRLRVRLLDGYLNNVARTVGAIDRSNSAALYDAQDGYGTNSRSNTQASGTPGSVLLEAWYRDGVGDFPLLAARAVESTVAKYAAGWKAQTLIDHSVSQTYRVNAWFSSIDEWADIQGVLQESPLVASYDATALAADGASVNMRVAGDVQQLVLSLRERNIIFWTVDDYVWNIATSSTYEDVRERVRPVSFERRQQGFISDGAPQTGEWRSGPQAESGQTYYAPATDEFSAPLERELSQPRQLYPATDDDAQDDGSN
ncbi:DUF2066 domain-containing protein [Parvularcula sp. IMCC14364]|uniref:DUF2066 domain-containing protein n=1 Tax=Parvularcula sp. IMCC14364 TaxID=3067902 RepID=UPI0027409D7C|nr:DUF2066 domain-containing protein [Parvularcula sp. IMCC14364]